MMVMTCARCKGSQLHYVQRTTAAHAAWPPVLSIVLTCAAPVMQTSGLGPRRTSAALQTRRQASLCFNLDTVRCCPNTPSALHLLGYHTCCPASAATRLLLACPAVKCEARSGDRSPPTLFCDAGLAYKYNNIPDPAKPGKTIGYACISQSVRWRRGLGCKSLV